MSCPGWYLMGLVNLGIDFVKRKVVQWGHGGFETGGTALLVDCGSCLGNIANWIKSTGCGWGDYH